MKVVREGHVYRLDMLDVDAAAKQLLTFVDREGDPER